MVGMGDCTYQEFSERDTPCLALALLVESEKDWEVLFQDLVHKNSPLGFKPSAPYA
jgi:hypothetical protein